MCVMQYDSYHFVRSFSLLFNSILSSHFLEAIPIFQKIELRIWIALKFLILLSLSTIDVLLIIT